MIEFSVKRKVLTVRKNNIVVGMFSCYDLVIVKPVLTNIIGIDAACDAEDYFKANCKYLKEDEPQDNQQLSLF